MSNNRFKFKNKAYKTVAVGEWLYEWFIDQKKPERSYMRVKAQSGIFEMKIAANTHAFGYLLAAAEQGLTEQLHGYIVSLYIPAMAMTQEQGITNDIQHAIGKWMKRREAEAKDTANKVTEAEEAASQAFMEDIASESGMSKKELKAKREADRQMMKEVLNEKEDGE